MYNTQYTVDTIKKLAKLKNIQIGKMLTECGLNKNALSSMQSRGSWLQANNLAKIADYLCVSVDYLLGRTDIMTLKISSEEDLIFMGREKTDCYRLLLGSEGLKYVKAHLTILIEQYGVDKLAQKLSVNSSDIYNFLRLTPPNDGKVLSKLDMVFSILRTNLKKMNFNLTTPDFCSNLEDIYTGFSHLKKEIDTIVGKTNKDDKYKNKNVSFDTQPVEIAAFGADGTRGEYDTPTEEIT